MSGIHRRPLPEIGHAPSRAHRYAAADGGMRAKTNTERRRGVGFGARVLGI